MQQLYITLQAPTKPALPPKEEEVVVVVVVVAVVEEVVVMDPPGRGHVHHRQEKLFGQPPDMFTGDRVKTKEFITQWELYNNLNHTNMIIGVPYS
jgi:hypothetical protein